jgi:hypothetical protein
VAEPHHKDFDGCRLAWFVFQLLLQRRTKAMAPNGFPSIINTDQGSGGLTFHTSNIANTTANALLATNIPEKVRIDADGEVGIGTNNPLAKLHIVNATSGAIRIEDGTQANGNILTSDANGVGIGEIEYDFHGL